MGGGGPRRGTFAVVAEGSVESAARRAAAATRMPTWWGSVLVRCRINIYELTWFSEQPCAGDAITILILQRVKRKIGKLE